MFLESMLLCWRKLLFQVSIVIMVRLNSSCWKNWTSRTENVAICYKSYERLWWNDSFSYKKQGCVKTRLHSNKVCIVYHKFLFWIRRSLYENKTCQFVAFINMERFHMFTDFYAASFSIKISFCETNNVFYLKN